MAPYLSSGKGSLPNTALHCTPGGPLAVPQLLGKLLPCAMYAILSERLNVRVRCSCTWVC